MNIAMVSEHASPLAVLGGADAGGQNVYVAALATEMARNGADVVVYTRRDDDALPARVPLAPRVWVEHVDAGPPTAIAKDLLLPYMDEFADHLAQAWRMRRPDIVHAHFWMSGRAALAAARPCNLPVVQTFHALGIVKRRHQGSKDTSPPERLAEERAIIRKSDRIVATCHDEVAELVRLGVEIERVTVIPCGVDFDLFRPDGPAERTRARYRIVTLGRLVARKGNDDVIRALVDLPDTELVIAGGLPKAQIHFDAEARRLAAIARDLGVADRVELRGCVERNAVPALLRSASAVVCVPRYEPFGMVALEAMACGVPVVAAAVGGLLDTVIDDVTGVHVLPCAPRRLAETLLELLPNLPRRARFGAEGAKRAARYYGWRRVSEATMDAYRTAVAARSHKRSPRHTAVARPYASFARAESQELGI